MKNIISKFINLLSLLIILLAAIILLNVVMTKSGEVPNIAGYSMLRVLTGSMEPALPTNSVIFVRRTAPEAIQVGDVISYFSADPSLNGAVNTHRVIDIAKNGSAITFATKGDANHVPDQYPPGSGDIIGVVVGSSPVLGIFIRLLSNPLVFLPLVLLPLLILLALNLVKVIRSTKELMRQEEEAAIREALEILQRKRQAEEAESDAAKK